MKKAFRLLLIFSICFCRYANAQYQHSDSTLKSFHYVGFTVSADLAYNQPDQLFNSYLARKIAIGISFTNSENDFLFYLGGGFKGWKVSRNSPKFSPQFTSDVIQSYHPISGNQHDSLSAISVYNMAQGAKDFYMFGYYSQYIDAGFILTRYRLRPSVSFYMGWENYVLFTPTAHFLDPNNESYSEWIDMQAAFKEVKLGMDALRIFSKKNLPFTLDIHVGYKWLNYKNLSFAGTPLSTYTNDQLTEKYRHGEKMTLGFTFRYWTNWSL